MNKEIYLNISKSLGRAGIREKPEKYFENGVKFSVLAAVVFWFLWSILNGSLMEGIVATAIFFLVCIAGTLIYPKYLAKKRAALIEKDLPFAMMELSLHTKAMLTTEKGIQKIIGGHFKSGDVEIVNKDLYIAEITVPKGKLDIQLVVEKGSGYSSSEEKEKKEFGMIAVDSIFSPVVKVNYSVEGARVGRKTNFDKLMLQIFTDKSVSPHDALMQSSQLMSEYFSYILSGKDVKKNENDEDKSDGNLLYKVDKKVYQTIIDELDLPTRVINALLREKIETVEDLIKKGKDELVGLKGLGEKSLDLIHKELEKLGIDF